MKLSINRIKEALNYISEKEIGNKYNIVKFVDIPTMDSDNFDRIMEGFSSVDEFIERARQEYKELVNNIYLVDKKSINILPSILNNSGYLLTIDSVENEYFFGREKELFKMQISLNKKIKNNVLLIGKPGVGKTKLVEEYARKNDIRNIFVVECAKLVGNSEYRGEFEQRVIDILEAAKKYDLIMFFDEIHTLINLGKSIGGISITDILKPYLLDEKRIFIGATTTKEASYFIQDEAFKRRFSIIKIDEPNFETLKGIKRNFEKNISKGEILSEQELDTVLIELKEKLSNIAFPDKLLDFLDYADSYYAITSDRCNITKLLGEYIYDQSCELFHTEYI